MISLHAIAFAIVLGAHEGKEHTIAVYIKCCINLFQTNCTECTSYMDNHKVNKAEVLSG